MKSNPVQTLRARRLATLSLLLIFALAVSCAPAVPTSKFYDTKIKKIDVHTMYAKVAGSSQTPVFIGGIWLYSIEGPIHKQFHDEVSFMQKYEESIVSTLRNLGYDAQFVSRARKKYEWLKDFSEEVRSVSKADAILICDTVVSWSGSEMTEASANWRLFEKDSNEAVLRGHFDEKRKEGETEQEFMTRITGQAFKKLPAPQF